MKTTRILMKAEDHKYPTKEERGEIKSGYPEIKHFSFSHANEMDAFNQGLSLKEISRINHLFEWNTALDNRFGKLNETYVYMMVHYNRRLSKDVSNNSESENAINKYLFEYYVEIFYYFFFSTRDIIGQLINVYYQLNIPEDKIYFYRDKDKFKDAMQKYPLIDNAISLFHKAASPASDIRNAFTHGFTPTQGDYRTRYEEANGMKSLEFGRGDTALSPEKLLETVHQSLETLRIFMDTLVIELK